MQLQLVASSSNVAAEILSDVTCTYLLIASDV